MGKLDDRDGKVMELMRGR